MSFIHVEKTKCKRDGLCLEACPAAIIRFDEDGYPCLEPGGESSCIGCGHCVAICPHGAMSHERLPAEAFRPASRPSPAVSDTVESLMRSRRSVREYSDTPVDQTVLEELLDTARFAPTAVNYQEVGWIVVRDPAQTRRFAEMTAHWLAQTKAMPRYSELFEKGREVVLRGAPHVVVAHGPSDMFFAETDCVIALSYLELAAAARGLGTCWAGILTRAARSHPPLAQALGVPEGRTVFGALMLGRPKYRYRLVPPRNAVNVRWI